MVIDMDSWDGWLETVAACSFIVGVAGFIFGYVGGFLIGMSIGR